MENDNFLKNIFIDVFYLENLKNKELKYFFYRNYIKELLKYNYPISIKVSDLLKEKHNMDTSSISDYNDYFDQLSSEIVTDIFNNFPIIKPFKLFFLKESINGKFQFINNAMYTYLFSYDSLNTTFKFRLFNSEISQLKIGEVYFKNRLFDDVISGSVFLN